MLKDHRLETEQKVEDKKEEATLAPKATKGKKDAKADK